MRIEGNVCHNAQGCCPRGGSRNAATSKVELFVIIENKFLVNTKVYLTSSSKCDIK